MNLFVSLFIQCVAIILAIDILFQIGGKLFLKDSDVEEDEN